jgi:hypothetical protein
MAPKRRGRGERRNEEIVCKLVIYRIAQCTSNPNRHHFAGEQQAGRVKRGLAREQVGGGFWRWGGNDALRGGGGLSRTLARGGS